VRRRTFIAALGGATAWPGLVWAQQPMPVIGWIGSGDPNSTAYLIAAFRLGLKEAGFVEGKNVSVEYRWSEGRLDRIHDLAADLVNRRVSAIVSFAPGALEAKSLTSTIPIVFGSGGDPVRIGLVANLNRPGSNATGVTFFAPLLEPKRLGLLHQMVPQVDAVAVLTNPSNHYQIAQLTEITEAARVLGVRIHVEHAATEQQIDDAFAAFPTGRVGAVLVGADPFFNLRRGQLIALAAKYGLPAMYEWREFPDAGGLMSYGTSLTASYRQIGIYVGQILRGTKPADLPVLQPTKFELVINLKTAKSLRIDVPPGLSASADEVIE
jgi:putative tryptophan/tyrosine transport system substrate-binding protein